MQFSKKLLVEIFPFPVSQRPPTNPVYTLIHRVTTSNYKGVIEESGWYRIRVAAVNGGSGDTAYGSGGSIEHTCWLNRGTEYLMWGASGQITYYPAPNGHGGRHANGTAGVLGGGGGTGQGRSGGGGGSAAGNGGAGDYRSGIGGGGAGFIAGLNTYQPSKTEEWSHAGLSVDTVECMVLCGGGGGARGNEGNRSGGGGGGAWGNGGSGVAYAGGAGPGGAGFGVGASTGQYGPGANGAWAIRDYTTNTFRWGTGVGTAGLPQGQVSIERVTQG